MKRTSVENELRPLPGWVVKASAPGALEDCTLVVATYKRPKELLELLQAVQSSADPPAEVTVVDGTPGEGVGGQVAQWAKSQPLAFDLLYVKSPAGLTLQRNVGIDISTKKYVFFLDDDCLPEEGYFRELRRVFVEDATGQVGAACGLIINGMNAPVPLRWRIRLALRLVPRIEPGAYHPSCTSVPGNLIKPFAGVRPIDILSGGVSAFRRDVFDIHRFSQFFTGYAYGEDIEMSLRVRRKWKIMWCGDAHVNHYHAQGGRPDAFRKGMMEVRNRFFIWKRNPENVGLSDKLRFWLDIGFLIVMDLGWFVTHPRRLSPLSHALGVGRGVVSCLAAPPRYEEPPARREYCLSRVPA